MSLSVAKSLAGFLLCCAVAGTAQAGTIVVNTFDSGQTPPPGGLGPNAPVGPTAANGVHALGVTFGFTENGLASTNATYGDTRYRYNRASTRSVVISRSARQLGLAYSL